MQKDFVIHGDLYRSFVPLFVGSEKCKNGHSHGPAVRPHWLIHFILSGKGTYRWAARCTLLKPGRHF